MSYHPPDMSVKESDWDPDRLGWLALSWFDGFGSRTLAKLRKIFGDRGGEALGVSPTTLESFGISAHMIGRFLGFRRSTNPTDLALKLKRHGIGFVTVFDPDYPSLLKQIADPPAALFIRGQGLRDSPASVAIVGTRGCTPYGRDTARELGRDLARAGLTIVSGLALGIDAEAHDAAIESDGRCVAVLGSGLDDDWIYPRANHGLAMRLLESGGTLVSEFPPGTEAFKHHFPLRNRIISGLCKAVVVVEASEQSGSLITSQQALEQNREVFAVPGLITNPVARGTNKLIRLGATLCTGAEDVMSAYGGMPPLSRQPPTPLDETERAVIDAMDMPRHADDLVRILGWEPSRLRAVLTSLEIKGAVAPQGPGTYTRTRFAPEAKD